MTCLYEGHSMVKTKRSWDEKLQHMGSASIGWSETLVCYYISCSIQRAGIQGFFFNLFLVHNSWYCQVIDPWTYHGLPKPKQTSHYTFHLVLSITVSLKSGTGIRRNLSHSCFLSSTSVSQQLMVSCGLAAWLHHFRRHPTYKKTYGLNRTPVMLQCEIPTFW